MVAVVIAAAVVVVVVAAHSHVRSSFLDSLTFNLNMRERILIYTQQAPNAQNYIKCEEHRMNDTHSTENDDDDGDKE